MKYVWILSVVVAVFQSCTKNELIPYEREPENRILEYKVVNSPEHMMGVIDHDKNTIRIAVPYYSDLEYLVGSLKLDDGATLLRMDSTEINLLEDELEPVMVGDTVSYIVRSRVGEYRTYTLTQEIVPHSNPLSVIGYGNDERRGAFNFVMHTLADGIYSTNANNVFYLFGNFLSSSHLGKFILTNRETGQAHEDFIRIVSVSPQADDMYVMTARISPEAAYGTYDVKLEHQGRTTDLPPVQIYYKLPPFGENYSSSASYAQGDTLTFSAYNYTFTKPNKLFVRINKSTRDGDVPLNFPENLYGRELEMDIVSSSRTEIKAVFPDIPTGLYRNWESNVINLFAVFSPEEGYEKNTPFNTEFVIGLPSGGGFNVLPRKN